MLLSLTIKNVALIDYAEIEFCDKLNILSGETGAGKSVILDSLNFVLGAKADKTMIRYGEKECIVSCVFVDYPEKVNQILKDYDIESSSELIIKRKFDLNGNGYIKLNGETVTATMLRKITSNLVDVHGQSEHFSLLSKTKQLECVDAGAEVYNDLVQLKGVLAQLNDAEKTFNALGGNPDERLKRIDILEYQINEIERADLREGEKEELILLKNKLVNLEKLYNAFNGASQALQSESGATDALISAEQSLKPICDLSNEYQSLFDRIRSAREEISDIGETLADLCDDLDADGLNLDEIEARLQIYSSFARKYGENYLDICKFLENAKQERDNLLNFEENASILIEKIKKLKLSAYANCEKISTKRKKYCNDFCKKVTQKLFELGMPNACFEIKFDDFPTLDEVERFSESGLDKIEFLFSANAGEPVKPLSKIISGGEMSRFMLALKTQLSVESRTYVFDEIDAGISGVTAGIVAKQFAQIALDKQIIAISHLPQITAMSDRSLLICKHEGQDKTFTEIKTLLSDGKVEEILRLIGGSISDPIAVTHAQNMINEAIKYKQELHK